MLKVCGKNHQGNGIKAALLRTLPEKLPFSIRSESMTICVIFSLHLRLSALHSNSDHNCILLPPVREYASEHLHTTRVWDYSAFNISECLCRLSHTDFSETLKATSSRHRPQKWKNAAHRVWKAFKKM